MQRPITCKGAYMTYGEPRVAWSFGLTNMTMAAKSYQFIWNATNVTHVTRPGDIMDGDLEPTLKPHIEKSVIQPQATDFPRSRPVPNLWSTPQ